LLALAAAGRERRADKGDLLLRQDDAEGRHLLILLEGEAVVMREGVEDDGALLATLGPGDMAGEIAFFDASPQPASVHAVTAARVLVLRRDDLLCCLRRHPELALDFLGAMARRLRLSGRRIAGICNHRAPRRLASALLALMEERGVRLKDDRGRRCLLLRNRPTQRCIAELAGTTRETVSRFLAQWERAGWLSDAHGDLMILDEGWLHRLAGEE
jgi:CRP/FNR family transcriptional regulator